jgi:hypothetical protein
MRPVLMRAATCTKADAVRAASCSSHSQSWRNWSGTIVYAAVATSFR